MATSEPINEIPNQKPATIRDVARLANVSVATVSRVLNGTGKVNAQIAERVQAIVAQLNYQPSRAARMLAGSHSAHLGLLVTDLQNPFFLDIVRGVEEVARQKGYLLIIGNTAEDPQKEQEYLELLSVEQVDGVVIVPVREKLRGLDILKARNIPVVSADRRLHDPAVDAVLINNVLAARQATEHLLANGYKRIGIITGPKSTTTANERLWGYHQALQEAGIAPDPTLELRGHFDEESGERLSAQLLELDPPIDAIFTANNRLTSGALHMLYARNLRVPDDIALVGFDEIQWGIPGLISITTVLQPAYEIGRVAASRLVQRLQQPGTPRQEIILQHQLQIRESSRPSQQPSPLTDSPILTQKRPSQS